MSTEKAPSRYSWCSLRALAVDCMMRSKKIRLIVAMAGVMSMAGKVSTQSTPASHRRLQRGTWSSVLSTDPASLSFGDIEMLDFDRDVIVTYDYADHKVKGIDRRGTLAWAVGGQGSQRGAFENVTDIRHDSAGNVWVVDPSVHRVTILSPAGVVARSYEHLPQWWRIAPRSDGLIWAYSPRDSAPAAYDTEGRLKVRLTLSRELGRLKPPASELQLIPGPRDSVLIVYEWADRFVVAGADGRSAAEHKGILRREFPGVMLTPMAINGTKIEKVGVDTSARLVTLSASWDGPLVYALVGGRAGDTTSTIDIYLAATGAYVGSRTLPRRVRAIAVRGDSVAGIVDGPALQLWTWSAKERGSR